LLLLKEALKYWTVWQVGFTAEGKITAADVRLYSNGGFSLDLSRPVHSPSQTRKSNP
jgi:xanthine dehydrogenase molybdopterin-binding subunit B